MTKHESGNFYSHGKYNIGRFGFTHSSKVLGFREWSGGAMVLGKLPVPGRPANLIIVWQGPLRL